MKMLFENKKKIIMMFGGLIVFIIVAVIIAGVVNKLKTFNMSYPEVEDKMVEAAEDYFSSRKDSLPTNENEVSEVSYSILVQEGYMKKVEKYVKQDNVICDGNVFVTKTGSLYNYAPFLDCGNKYVTTYLYEKLLDYLVTSGDGLYSLNQETNNKTEKVYVFRGEYPKNYVSIDNRLWRIVKVNSDNTISLILDSYDKNIVSRYSWDDRYNVEKEYEAGVNNYEKSRIRAEINKLYNSDLLFNNSFKSKLVSRKLCIGDRGLDDSKNDGSIECSKKSTFQDAITLLTSYDFINASLDSNCSKIEDASCMNYSYLSEYEYGWWLLTTSKSNTYSGFIIDKSGLETKLSSNGALRPVINLNQNIIYVSGAGTSTDPIIIK